MAWVWCDGGWLWVRGGGGGVEGLVQMKREEEEREKWIKKKKMKGRERAMNKKMNSF